MGNNWIWKNVVYLCFPNLVYYRCSDSIRKEKFDKLVELSVSVTVLPGWERRFKGYSGIWKRTFVDLLKTHNCQDGSVSVDKWTKNADTGKWLKFRLGKRLVLSHLNTKYLRLNIWNIKVFCSTFDIYKSLFTNTPFELYTPLKETILFLFGTQGDSSIEFDFSKLLRETLFSQFQEIEEFV